MSKVIDKISVVVAESALDGRKRIVIEIEAKESLFHISDLLAKEGALESLPQLLKPMLKQAVFNYSEGGKAILSRVASTAKSRNTSTSAENKARVSTGTPKPL